ncbi:MAG TPA: cytochrome P450 [Streptosporangiaceae bacterium]|nr:cytochrome P450 [Streptosporangiaceae bacterium]
MSITGTARSGPRHHADLAQARAAAARLLTPPGPEDPYPDYAILRAHAPVLAAGPQVWLVSGYAAGRDILADPAFGVQDAAWYDANRPQWREGAASWTLYQGVQSRNPPDHTRMRRVLGRCFTARRLALLRDRVAALTHQFLDEVAAQGDGDTPVDLMSALAFPLPVTVVNDLLGVPEEDRAEVHGLAGRVFDLTELIVSDEDRRSADAAAVTFRRYWTELIAGRRKAPGPELTSQLIAAADAGELSDEELLSSLIFLHGAGYGTTAALLGNATVALLADPALAARLRADPGLAPAVVDESLRHEAPTQLTPRLARRPAQAGGTQVPEGHLAVLLLGAANRDPDRFPQPGRFDVDRQDNRPLSFGGGIHYCLGAPLSRMEAAIVLPELVRRFPRLRLAGKPQWRRALRMRQLSCLPVRAG